MVRTDMALPWFVVILVEILVLFIVLWLCTRIVAGATKTNSKLVIILLIAVIAVLVIPPLQSIPGMFGLGGLGTIIGYTVIILLVHVLIDIDWDKAIIISFLAELIVLVLVALGFTYLPPLT
jgi:hypothetical protein